MGCGICDIRQELNSDHYHIETHCTDRFEKIFERAALELRFSGLFDQICSFSIIFAHKQLMLGGCKCDGGAAKRPEGALWTPKHDLKRASRKVIVFAMRQGLI